MIRAHTMLGSHTLHFEDIVTHRLSVCVLPGCQSAADWAGQDALPSIDTTVDERERDRKTETDT